MRAFIASARRSALNYPTLHVGGTSGKGSTATMLAAASTRSGKRVGLHTKPHLMSLTERMRVDGIADLGGCFRRPCSRRSIPAIERVAAEHGRPTYYETLLALAFVAFARDEGRRGGHRGRHRRNARRHERAASPRVAIITNISLDHTEILGDTTATIARDKAGIAKRGVPLVSDVRDPGARARSKRVCAAVGAPFISVRDTVTDRIAARRTLRSDVRRRDAGCDATSFRCRCSDVPAANAATAIRALELLGDDLRPSRAQSKKAMSRLVIPGRMEFFPSHPRVVFDIAHNPDKTRPSRRRAARNLPGPSLRRPSSRSAKPRMSQAILAAARRACRPRLSSRVRCGIRAARRLGRTRLASIAEDLGIMGPRGRRSGRSVLDRAPQRRRRRRGLVTGSTFVVATLREWWFANVGAEAR